MAAVAAREKKKEEGGEEEDKVRVAPRSFCWYGGLTPAGQHVAVACWLQASLRL